MKNIAIIPARSGSKGLIDKNVRLLNGKPLLAYSIKAAKESNLFDEIMVSTDSELYSKIALEYGAKVPFLRSSILSSDTASSWDVVKDVINKYKELNTEFETIALLQPTSPLRTSNDIINGYNLMKEKSANIIVGVCETDHSPLWSNTLPNDYSMNHFLKSEVVNLPRQKIPTYYRINGALYIIKVDYLMKTSDLYTDKSFALVMNKENSIDIDDQIDFVIAETIIKTSSCSENMEKTLTNLSPRFLPDNEENYMKPRIEEAFKVLNRMMDSFETWFPIDASDTEEEIEMYKEGFARAKLSLELGEYDRDVLDYLCRIHELVTGNEEYSKAIRVFMAALGEEFGWI